MPCFVHDERQAVTLQYTVLSTLPESTSLDFRFTHEKGIADIV
jgi:hypothetical protein